MARITVEDCLQSEPNLFNLVLLAAKRARRLANGAEATVEWENDKPTVVALREIAAGNITLEMLEEPEEPVQAPVSELDMPSDFRAISRRFPPLLRLRGPLASDPTAQMLHNLLVVIAVWMAGGPAPAP